MPFKIRYSLRAQEELLQLLDYINREFGSGTAREIYQQIESILDKIAEMPEIFPESTFQKGLRRCVFSKQTSIFYRVNAEYVEIVSFRDNRMDPKKF